MKYLFEEVRAALRKHWGLELHRGGSMTDLGKDGRWDVMYSKTGFVLSGDFPGRAHTARRYVSLSHVVQAADLDPIIKEQRRG